jgi:hypothetical protein
MKTFLVPEGFRMGGQTMHVMAVSAISDNEKFWSSLKKAYGQLPRGARWTLAVGSTDGTKGVNVIVYDSIDSVKSFFEEHAGPFGTTDYFEADAASAVGLPR